MTSALIVRIGELLRFKAGPQDLPASTTVLLLAVAAYVGVGVLGGHAAEAELPAQRALLGAALHIAVIALLLTLRGLRERIVQTVTAMMFAGAALSLLSLPLVVAAGPRPGALLVLLLLGLLAWTLGVYGHIYRHALAITMPLGVLTALGVQALFLVLSGWLL
ncbi:MAG: hypothetical protein R3233_00790 [Xanthomonadales bacterium]|nr:hypothetical protein [Xanthomonadales bacterium]